MSWNYRVMKHTIAAPSNSNDWFGIHEVYYDEDGAITMYSSDPMSPMGETEEELKSDIDKMMDAFINILAGGHGLVEINTRVRPDRALQLAFGRMGCAEQLTVSETFDTCTGQNVEVMREVLHQTYRQFSRGYSHNYQEQWQLLDADLTGMLAGRQ